MDYYSGKYKCIAVVNTSVTANSAESETVAVKNICKFRFILQRYCQRSVSTDFRAYKSCERINLKGRCTCILDPAIWGGSDFFESASIDDKEKQIMCNVCAEPPIDLFTWKFNGEALRLGIVQNVS